MSVNKLREGSFNKIVSKAQEFAKMSRCHGGTSFPQTGTGESEEDERAWLVDVSDNDGETTTLV